MLPGSIARKDDKEEGIFVGEAKKGKGVLIRKVRDDS